MINTGLPIIGTIDFKNPLDLAIWGGIGLSVITLKGTAQVAVPIGLLVARYWLTKLSL